MNASADNVEEIDLSDRGLPVVPMELYVGKEAALQLGRTVVLNLAKNALQTLPERSLPMDVGAKRRALGALGAAAHGDLLFHCANLQVRECRGQFCTSKPGRDCWFVPLIAET